MRAKEVVECSAGDACEGDHHGWDCPLSDPTGDLLRSMGDRPSNPLLAGFYDDVQRRLLEIEP